MNECKNSSLCEKGSCHNTVGSYYCLYDDNSDKYGDNSSSTSHPQKGKVYRLSCFNNYLECDVAILKELNDLSKLMLLPFIFT